MNDPTGRVYLLRANGELRLLINNAPYPNGLVLNREETQLNIAVTRSNSIWRMSASTIDMFPRVGLFIQLGGPGGPDGLAIDEEDSLAIAHSQLGVVWLFNRFGEPVYRIRSCAGRTITNLAYGGPDMKTLYITEADTGSILIAQMETPGQVMYSHS